MSAPLSRREFFELSAGAYALAAQEWFGGLPAGRSVVRASRGIFDFLI